MTPPPIADPRDFSKRPSPAAPFRGLRVFVVANAVLLPLSWLSLLYDPETLEDLDLTLVFVGVIWTVWGLMLWWLWHASNAARLSYWWLTVASYAFLFQSMPEALPLPLLVRAFGWLSHALALFGLVWLQLPDVKARFGRDKPF